jgi:hypothetical protein
MNQEIPTKPKTATKYTVGIETKNLLAFNALLEQINQAARAGDLEFEEGSISVELAFSAGVERQTVAPLEAVINAQDHILGTCCWITHAPLIEKLVKEQSA